jgi:hypothetical protein
MRPILTTSLMAILAAISISACSSASSSANAADNSAAAADNSAASANNAAASADNSAASSDNSAASSDNSAAAAGAAPAAGGAIPVYPGAAVAALPAAAGTPPPGGKSWATTDSFDKVKAWYTANLKGAVLKGSTPTGAMYMIGDEKTGTVVMLQADKGKVWILSGPANDMK